MENAIYNQEVLTDIPGHVFASHENKRLESRKSNLHQNVRCYSLRSYAASPPSFVSSRWRNQRSHLPCTMSRTEGPAKIRVSPRLCTGALFHLLWDPMFFRFTVNGVPFRRWLRWRPEHPPLSPLEIIHAIDDSLEDAMARHDAEGATGEWVALMGFSQGAKVSASLLYRQQIIGNATSGPQFRIAVLLAGWAPLIALDPGMKTSSVFLDASQITDLPSPQREVSYAQKPTLRIPTLHVHGLRDTGVDLHRKLSEDFCDPHSRRVIEWDGDHRVPLKANEVARIVSQIRQLATETGVSLGTIE